MSDEQLDRALDLLRRLPPQITANTAFDTYRDLYYEGGVCSCYFWNTEGDDFAAAILIKKTGDGVRGVHGCWDAIHVVDVKNEKNQATYKMTSTIMLWMKTTTDGSGDMDLGGNMTKTTEETLPVNTTKPHIANIGTMIEDVELRMRYTLNDVYFGKTKDICNDLRSISALADVAHKRKLQEKIASQVTGRE
ncbi:hypothetical protein SARC_01092 [Sphaeroforma arctica JP610]|uniref:F-actin-capping protein subunit beta n=1 Tax=Sphaeroforma arctica JP610 TaxID=667725 RepID=A0A0L0GER7_9EUKA|nr:hypothetical protein SARC_01092 [Sphaeroforma arctica JP610]KNC86758.1 hypothetical protein SARC_01092 [Sphaeroforma arctica JP610]|eukprot:XP_014160660.1 hypothetical protein SARC_01092 [Sphaeroforma arctica JP610]